MSGAGGFAGSGAARFGDERLRAACRERGVACDYILIRDGTLPEASYAADARGDTHILRAADEEGALAALLDLKDSVEARGAPLLDKGLHAPAIRRRGIKLNVPLDVRTPSYSDCGDSAQENIAAMWDAAFWRGLLDRMALNRYNTLTLWNLCPFPSMARVPEYPDAALDDVMVSSAMAGGTSRALGFYTPAMHDNLICVRRMTIAEKTAFWNGVLAYARDRCIRVYLFTWNLYLYGLEDTGYGLTERADDGETRRYIRASTAALMRALPLLAGIGVTAGENLCAEWTDNQDLRWVRETYGRGVEDALADDPDRRFTLILRTHMTTLPQFREAFSDYRGEVDISVKYAMAHMTATERPRFCDDLIAAKPPGTGMWMTLRQDDFYTFPWADDEFLEALLRQMPKADLRGFYYGADGVIWGVDRQSRVEALNGRYFIDKHFFAFALIGRLGWRGTVSDAEKIACLRAFLPGLPPEKLLVRLRLASRAARLIGLAHWRNYDLQWYPEACCYLDEPDRTTAFDDLNEFVRCGACPGAGVASVAETAAGAGAQPRNALDVADDILRYADLADAVPLPGGSGDAEREMCADLARITHLARYYAWKLRAAVALARGRARGDERALRDAAGHMRRAEAHWRRYSAETAAWYKPRRLSRLRGVVSPDMWDGRVQRDIDICEDRRNHSC